jgi:hypothetical protein
MPLQRCPLSKGEVYKTEEHRETDQTFENDATSSAKIFISKLANT